jgi:hypothetical protein
MHNINADSSSLYIYILTIRSDKNDWFEEILDLLKSTTERG